MKFQETTLPDGFVIEPEPYEDDRGTFSRLFCMVEFEEIGHSKNIMQINHSINRYKGAIRGMHFQYPPFAEIKMVKCLRGSVFDVIVDLRQDSAAFLKWHGEVLSSENMKIMYIPEGLAHGFQTLEDNCELLYLHTEIYSAEHEDAVRFDDPLIDIKWPVSITEISKKDLQHPYLDDNFKGIEL